MDFLSLINKRIVLFDGAMGTMLLQAGLSGGACPEIWNKSHPDIIENIHKAYFEAGADVVETNTFGGTSIKLNTFNLPASASELNRLAANLAKKVAPSHSFVAGSVGPTGQFLKPMGDFEESQFYESFKEQILALESGGVDLIIVETMMDLAEATIAVKAVKENTSLPVVATMTFNKTPSGYFTLMGVTPEDAVKSLYEAGADVVGSNCGNGPDEMVDVADSMGKTSKAPLLFQANAGLPKLVNGQSVYDMGPEEYGKFIPVFIEKGAQLVGGCCGTTPKHIKLIKSILDNL